MTNLNDDSNPQQGSTTAQAHTHTDFKRAPTDNSMYRIPPNKKDSRKLFVGGLPPEVTNVEFREFFQNFGQILDSIVMIDRENGKSRGFGFITFVDPAVASRIVADHAQDDSKSKVNISGKWCEVKFSVPKKGSSFEGGMRYSSEVRGRSMDTPATSEMSSRNSSIDTRNSSRPPVEIIPDANVGEVPVNQGHHEHMNHHQYNGHAMGYPHALGGHMPYYPPLPAHMNIPQPPPYMYQYSPQGAQMMYNNEVMYSSQYYGNYGMYHYHHPMFMPPQYVANGHDEYPSTAVEEEQQEQLADEEE